MQQSLGLIIPQRASTFGAATVPELLALAPLAEQSGLFDTLWVGDSLTSKARTDSLAFLGAMAGMTSTMRLAVGCMASFTVRDPALFAYQWASLDQVSQGRMLLAVCNGLQKIGAASEIEGSHFGGVKDKERPARLEEYLDLIRQLWTGEPVTFHGTYVNYEDLTILPRPVQDPPPAWISGNPPVGPAAHKVLRRVATKADGLLSTQIRPGYIGEITAMLGEHLDQAGRDVAGFPVGAYHSVNIGPDPEACLDEAHSFFGNYYGPMFDRAGAASITAYGTPEDCAEQLRVLLDEGVSHIAIRIASWHQREQFDLLTDKVLPLLNEATA